MNKVTFDAVNGTDLMSQLERIDTGQTVVEAVGTVPGTLLQVPKDGSTDERLDAEFGGFTGEETFVPIVCHFVMS